MNVCPMPAALVCLHTCIAAPYSAMLSRKTWYSLNWGSGHRLPSRVGAMEVVINRHYNAGLSVLRLSKGREDQESQVHLFAPSFMASHGWVPSL
jgi:hypothetical protein